MDRLVYTYRTTIDAPMKKVWDFFQDPTNLARIQRFPKVNVKESGSDEGSKVKLKIGYLGVGVNWDATIETVKKPHYFVDTAEKPPFPFTYWRHTHRFERENGKSVIIDELEFAARIPSAISSKLLTYMFQSREKQIMKAFQEN
ncbi:SRPBCC family protein [Alkalicoccobacillus murimartini]|uniref:Ligand-binding SRPBCC domain-containing protein n=1 Tax=Alkalicoccobacillus murimartini TaxID=171685 RepID=A0ABT9YCR7_9BACI|nr:hypothetical protein [Alkalicoccobacillus murimartini]MDQ0205640.1 ligand-binding SRPBCC domain-containing protein [Alkalicoccobacillus murimartini]